jgi:hypothetical protein
MMQRDDVNLKGTSPSLFFIKRNKKPKKLIYCQFGFARNGYIIDFTPMILKTLLQ